MKTNEEKHMDRRDFLSTITALPLLKFEPWFPTDGVQELILPHDLAYGLERHCSLPFEQRVVRSDEAAKIAEEINIKTGAVFLAATDMYSDEWKLDYSGWSWFHTSERRLIVNYDDEWGWPVIGGGWPSFIRSNDLHVMRADWFMLAIDVFGVASKQEFFEDDVLLADITKQIAERLMKADIDPDPWPGLGYGWREIAAWLAEGETLIVPFPNQRMI